MTATEPAPQVDRSKLRDLRRVGDGGQGVVYVTDAVKINGAWKVAYKEYLPTTTFNPVALREMVEFVPGLDRSNGEWLCDATAWPAALVMRDGRPAGFLMRQVPDRFYRPWGDNGASVPAALQYLLNPQAYLTRKQIVLDHATRLRLLVSIADTMTRLHSLGVVVGDLSPNNLLVDLASADCFFIDCDAMRLHGQDVLRQVETPEWQVPRPGREPIATSASDAYKFGLLAVRLFAQDQMGRDGTALRRISPRLGALADRGLGADSTNRPTPAEWIPALNAALMPSAIINPRVNGTARARTASPNQPPAARGAVGLGIAIGVVLVIITMIIVVVRNH
jgi:hypothetical protein